MDAPLTNERELTEPPVEALDQHPDVDPAQELAELKAVDEELRREGIEAPLEEAQAYPQTQDGQDAEHPEINPEEDAAKAHS